MTEVLLGVDIGSASTKGVLVTPTGEIVRRATRNHSISMPRAGWAEHDPESTWWGEFVEVCRELVTAGRERVVSVGVSGIGPCVVPCDAEHRPLRPAILYGIDTRAQAEVDELTHRLGEDEILSRCGSTLSSQALGPKLLWLARHEPNVWRATRYWHMANSFVVARLTGTWMLDHHSASQCDPIYDMWNMDWNAAWAEDAIPGLQLPPLAWPGEIVAAVHDEAAAATGLTAGTPVIAGTVDAWAEAVSVGVRDPGSLMIMYGSTVFLVLGSDHAADNSTIWTTRGVDPGSLTLAAGLSTAGSVASWIHDLTDNTTHELLLTEAEAAGPGAGGLLVLPYFAGERTPIHDPNARGTITGLTLNHRRGHLYRAVLEGTAFAIRHIMETMNPDSTVRIVAVGGGTQGRLWPQIVSDVTGLRQEIPSETIGASYGDARLAAEAIGLATPSTSWMKTATTIQPAPGLAANYDDLYELYRDLYPATRDIQHSLAARQLA